MAPNLNLNLPLEDYGALLVLLGTGALGMVLRNWGRARQADPEAIELEEVGAARGTTPGGAQHAVLGDTPLRSTLDAIDNPVASGTMLDPVDIPVATPLRTVDNPVAVDVALDATDNGSAIPLPVVDYAVTGDTTLDAIVDATATPLPIVDSAIADDTTLDAVDNPIATHLPAVATADNVAYDTDNLEDNAEVRPSAMLSAADNVNALASSE